MMNHYCENTSASLLVAHCGLVLVSTEYMATKSALSEYSRLRETCYRTPGRQHLDWKWFIEHESITDSSSRTARHQMPKTFSQDNTQSRHIISHHVTLQTNIRGLLIVVHDEHSMFRFRATFA